MMSQRDAIVGATFGALIVIGPDPAHVGRIICRCACGQIKSFFTGNVVRKLSTSCGCLKGAKIRARFTTHGQAGLGRQSAEYKVWGCMLSRAVTGSAKKSRKDYIDRGITVCDRWLSFENFFADMGKRPSPSHQIDRKDNNGNYEPSNCRWVTRKEQCRNRRTSRLITHDGVTASMAEWVERTGISQGTMAGRVKRGKSSAEILAPVKHRHTETES